jgi:hypothetical protein
VENPLDIVAGRPKPWCGAPNGGISSSCAITTLAVTGAVEVTENETVATNITNPQKT